MLLFVLRIIMAKEFRGPGKDVVHKIWQEFRLNEQRVKEAVEALKKWLAMEPHLPEESGSLHEVRLERWLIRCKNSMERTKQSIDLYYTLKSLSPDLMCDWDPRSKRFLDIAQTACWFPMPKLTPEGDRVIMIKYLKKDAINYIHEDLIKMILISNEARMCEEYCFSDIYVCDFENYTLGHASRVTFTIAKKGIVCLMDALDTRLKAFHIINAPSYAEVFIWIFKAVLNPKLTSRVYVHGKDLTEFRKQVPRMCLPDDLGGTGGSLQENWNLWLKKVDSYRDWFLQHENFKSDESKRQGGALNSDDLFGFEGSFKELTVD
ncbi:alpha-tocopherol transfer protein-like isoform X3 [Periplaneta americana]|uniref:alpha-tocopherol transfer protein-like isoform X3 n=1 Tax=Periplaneta americana TaxID=6978 RepID=UPI0037E87BE1